MGFHLPLLPVQIPVEAHGEGHEQHLQVRFEMAATIPSDVQGCVSIALKLTTLKHVHMHSEII